MIYIAKIPAEILMSINYLIFAQE